MCRLGSLTSLATRRDEHSCDITVAVHGQDSTAMTATRHVDVESAVLDRSDVRVLVVVPHRTEGTGSTVDKAA